MKLKYNKQNDRYYVKNLNGWITEFHCGDTLKVFIDNLEEKNGLWFRFELNDSKPFEQHWYLINEEKNIIIYSPFDEILYVELG